MATAASLVIAIEARTAALEAGLKKSIYGIRSLQETANRATTSLRNMLVGAAAFAGIQSGFRSMVTSAMDFDTAMRNSMSIMGNVSDTMKSKLEQTAIEVSRTTKFSAQSAAESYYFLTSAGLDAAQSLAALPQVAKFAQAGNFDMARATDLATDAQSALGMTSKDAQKNLENLTRVTDVFVKASVLANASTEQFSISVTNQAGTAARSAGKDIEETVAVLAAFADQGIKAEEAGTRFGIVMRDLQTKAIANRAAFEQMGVTVFDAQGKMRNTADIIADLERTMNGMEAEQKRVTLGLLGFSDKSVGAIQSLLGMSEKIRKYESDLRKAGGTTEEVSDKQMSEFIRATQDLNATLLILSRAIAAAVIPALTQLAGATNHVIKSTMDASNAVGVIMQTVIRAVAAYATYVAIMRTVAVAVGAYVAIMKVLRGAMQATTAAQAILLALSGPKGWAMLAVGAAAAAVAIFGVNAAFEGLEANIGNANEKLQEQVDIANQANIVADQVNAKQEAMVGNLEQENKIRKEIEDRKKEQEDFQAKQSQRAEELREQAMDEFERIDRDRKEIEQFRRGGLIDEQTFAKLMEQIDKRIKDASGASEIEADRQRRAEQITKSVMTPLEQYEERMEEIGNLLDRGHITIDTAGRAASQAIDDLENAIGRNNPYRGAESIVRGSREFEMLSTANVDPRVDKQLQIADAQLDELRVIARNVSAQTGEVVNF